MRDHPTSALQEDVDFYREGTCTVFTEAYLRRRGYCCESACRHCPWGFRGNRRTDVPLETASHAD